jgi:hypothetical protein
MEINLEERTELMARKREDPQLVKSATASQTAK